MDEDVIKFIVRIHFFASFLTRYLLDTNKKKIVEHALFEAEEYIQLKTIEELNSLVGEIVISIKSQN